MSLLSNLNYCAIQKESTPGTVIIPNRVICFTDSDISTKMNIKPIEGIAGQVRLPLTHIKGQIDSSGSINMDLDRENVVIALASVFDAASAINNGDGTYTYNFNADSYALPSFSTEIAKAGIVERLFGATGSSLTISSNTETIKWSLSLTGLGAYTTSTVTNVATDTVTLSNVKGLVVGDYLRTNFNTTTAGIIVSINQTNSTVTVQAGQGANFVNGDAVYLVAQSLSSTVLKPFPFYELASIKLASNIAGLSGAGAACVKEFEVGVQNANEPTYCAGSNFASRIKQGTRTMTGRITMDADKAYVEYNAYCNNGTRAIELVFQGGVIGSGTARESLTIKGVIGYTEASSSLSSGAFVEVPLSFNFLSDITVSVRTTLASI